jgi:hypothetical protein
MNFLKKCYNVLTSDNAYTRIILFINKTEILRHIFKSLRILQNFPLYLKRKRAVITINSDKGEQQKIDLHLNELVNIGYTEVTELMDQNTLIKLVDYGNTRLKQSEDFDVDKQKFNKKIWKRLSDIDQKLDSGHPLVEVSLSTPILHLLNKYFNSPAFLDYTLLTLSTNENPEAPLTQSQLWHFDRDDLKVVKLFVYLSDVNNEDDGPFTLYNKADSQKIPFYLINKHWDDRFILDSVKLKPTQFIKPKLSAFLVCTTECLHMGSRLKFNHHRLMTTSTYITLPTAHPWAASQNYEVVTPLNEIQRLALQKF